MTDTLTRQRREELIAGLETFTAHKHFRHLSMQERDDLLTALRRLGECERDLERAGLAWDVAMERIRKLQTEGAAP